MLSESLVAEIQKKIEDAFEVFDHDGGNTVDVRCPIFLRCWLCSFSTNRSICYFSMKVACILTSLILYLWYPSLTTTVTDIQKASMVWHDSNWHQKSMEGILEVGSGGQCPSDRRPHNPATWFYPRTTTMVFPEPFPHRSTALWGM